MFEKQDTNLADNEEAVGIVRPSPELLELKGGSSSRKLTNLELF